ncbi:MAG: hypothetical protein V3S51_01325 [Dehalococcoidia bacterium]
MANKHGLDGIWEDLDKNLIVSVETRVENSSGSDLALVTEFTVTNGGIWSDSRPDIFYDEVELTVGVPPATHVERHANLAGGESFTYEHRSPYGDLGRIVFSLDAVVSPSQLLRVKRAASSVPSQVAGLSMASYVEVLKDIDLHKWLRDTIETMLVPGPSTTQAETEAQQGKLRDTAMEIGEAKKQLQSISGFVARPTDADKRKYSEHKKLVEDYLTYTAQACSELRKMLDTLNSKTLSANLADRVSSLSVEASRVDAATEGLLSG